MHLGPRVIGVALVLGLVAAGCGNSARATGATSTTATTATIASNVSPYASLGGFSVGVTTVRLSTGDDVEVWYPANGSVGVGSDTYDVRAFLPAAVAARLGANVHAYVSTIANRNVAVGAAGEQFPLVLFSHGTAGFREESTFLTTRLASWGMVVAAPEQPSSDLAGVLAPTNGHVPSDADDLLATIDLMQHANAAGGPFAGRIDLSKIAVVGFDDGGQAAITVAADPRVDGYVALATGSGSSAVTAPSAPPTSALPAKPSLFVAGAADRVVPAADTSALYRVAPAPSYEWVIDGAGHNAFDDLCIVAKGGLPGFADQAGIGNGLSPSLRARVTDGCAAPDLAVTKTWTVIDEVVTAFLRHVVGPDAEPVGVGPSGARTVSGVNVTVSARLR